MNKYSFQNEFWNFSTYQQEFYFHQVFGAKRGKEILLVDSEMCGLIFRMMQNKTPSILKEN